MMRFHHHAHRLHRFHHFRHGGTKGSAIVMLLILAAALYVFFVVMHGMERLKPALGASHHALWAPMRSVPDGVRGSHELGASSEPTYVPAVDRRASGIGARAGTGPSIGPRPEAPPNFEVG